MLSREHRGSRADMRMRLQPSYSPESLVDPDLHARGAAHEVWRWMRVHAPVHWHPPADSLPGFWSLTRYEDVRAVYGGPKLFSSAQGVLLRPLRAGPDPGSG